MAHPSQMLYLDSLRAPGALCIESKRVPAGLLGGSTSAFQQPSAVNGPAARLTVLL